MRFRRTGEVEDTEFGSVEESAPPDERLDEQPSAASAERGASAAADTAFSDGELRIRRAFRPGTGIGAVRAFLIIGGLSLLGFLCAGWLQHEVLEPFFLGEEIPSPLPHTLNEPVKF